MGIFLSFTNDSETLIVQDLLKTSPFWNEYRVGLALSLFGHVFCCDCIDSEAVSIRNRIRITLIVAVDSTAYPFRVCVKEHPNIQSREIKNKKNIDLTYQTLVL